MGIELGELLTRMADAGLSFRKAPSGDIEIRGNAGVVNNEIRQAVQDNYRAIQDCLPPAPPTAVEKAEADATNIKGQLEEFGDWIFTHAPWAAVDLRHSDDIDKRIAAAVDTNDPQQVAAIIEALRSHLEMLTWAAEVFP